MEVAHTLRRKEMGTWFCLVPSSHSARLPVSLKGEKNSSSSSSALVLLLVMKAK